LRPEASEYAARSDGNNCITFGVPERAAAPGGMIGPS
jgi:hypothetical protein